MVALKKLLMKQILFCSIRNHNNKISFVHPFGEQLICISTIRDL